MCILQVTVSRSSVSLCVTLRHYGHVCLVTSKVIIESSVSGLWSQNVGDLVEGEHPQISGGIGSAAQPGICLGGTLLRLEGPKFEAEGQDRGRGS